MNPVDTCESCDFFSVPQPDHEKYVKDHGYCKRFPPQVKYEFCNSRTVSPLVHYTNQCGEHRMSQEKADKADVRKASNYPEARAGFLHKDTIAGYVACLFELPWPDEIACNIVKDVLVPWLKLMLPAFVYVDIHPKHTNIIVLQPGPEYIQINFKTGDCSFTWVEPDVQN